MQVWFVTGAISGCGRGIVLHALELGANVVATARAPSKFADLPRNGRLLLGQFAYDLARTTLDPRRAEARRWKHLAISADRPDAAGLAWP